MKNRVEHFPSFSQIESTEIEDKVENTPASSAIRMTDMEKRVEKWPASSQMKVRVDTSPGSPLDTNIIFGIGSPSQK